MASRTALSSKDTVGMRRAVLSQIAISRFSSVENKTSYITINTIHPFVNIIHPFVSIIHPFVSIIYPFINIIHPFVNIIHPFTTNLQCVVDHYLFFQHKQYNKIN